jgi:calcium-dependent protein kinase
MIDFGLAVELKAPDQIMNLITGSPYYIAPEILSGQYTMKCDIWAMGILMYVMLCGKYPFTGRTNTELFEAIKTGTIKVDSAVWQNYSKASINFLYSLLKYDP